MMIFLFSYADLFAIFSSTVFLADLFSNKREIDFSCHDLVRVLVVLLGIVCVGGVCGRFIIYYCNDNYDKSQPLIAAAGYNCITNGAGILPPVNTVIGRLVYYREHTEDILQYLSVVGRVREGIKK